MNKWISYKLLKNFNKLFFRRANLVGTGLLLLFVLSIYVDKGIIYTRKCGLISVKTY